MSKTPEPEFQRIARIHDEVVRASLAHAVMTMETAGSAARDEAVARYVRAMDAVFDDLEELRRSGTLTRIEAILRRAS